MFYNLIQMAVSEINFWKRYQSAEDLEVDEKRDMYPPRFITHIYCHHCSTLDVSYEIQLKKERKIAESYTVSIFVKGNVCLEFSLLKIIIYVVKFGG